MNQTEPTEQNVAAPTTTTEEEERIRKVYVKDVKNGAPIHTVFKAVTKERHSSRSGKPYLSVSLVDKTGQLDARVFENVDPAEAAFAAGDYLLVKGKIGVFHGKLQLVIDRLERLDPEPIDPNEFNYVAPPPTAEAAVATAGSPNGVKAEHGPDAHSPKAIRQRVLRLLDDPKVLQALDVLLTAIDERGVKAHPAHAAAHEGAPAPGTGRRRDRRERGPRVEHKPRGDDATTASKSEKPELKRDPGLPEGLSFKPLTALVGEPPSQS